MTPSHTSNKLIVIGGGAAGFFCAINAARLSPGLNVVLLEKSSRVLGKVKISGGGRCNVTHACYSIAEMVKRYPRGAKFLKKAFHHFFTTDTINWFSERGVALHAEPDGRMFPQTNTSQTIIECLLRETTRYKIDLRMNAGVNRIEVREKGGFKVHLASGAIEEAEMVCIATGGFSKAAQFDWITQLGHHIMPPVPSLFTFNIPKHPITSLMGITVEQVTVKIQGSKLQESGPLLVTHWGISGPAVLKLSAWAAVELAASNYNFTAVVNWLPDYHENSMVEKLQLLRFEIATQKVINRNPFGLPARLWEFLLQQCGITDAMRWAYLPAREQNKLAKALCSYALDVQGKTTFKEEFVTAGGVVLEEIDVNTLQSKLVPGLFFAGEVINVDGITGGFNFQNAWTTGWIAARAIAQLSA